MNLAMWSGPRNLSTAMMYSFAQRQDFTVWDEPFYSPYLLASGADHPMRDEILRSTQTDAALISAACAQPSPSTPHIYQKHITHHLLPEFDRSWMNSARHVFLIRHPARVIASYQAKREHPSLHDIGFVEQSEIFDHVKNLGQSPLVIDATDIRARPEPMLRALCAALDLPFDPAMLSWPAGGNAADGIWAAHWYGAVHRSTGFAAAEGPLPDPDRSDLMAAAMPLYEQLYNQRITATYSV